ncbi:MAG: APC family permease [Gammaproteobacteria bacterium]|nr:APC family permease [Gammaproteobacteria bacterium]
MNAPALRRSLRPAHLAAIGMGTTIGVGWIVVTGGWIVGAGPGGAALAFLLGGLVMILVAVCYADAATRLPEASGEYGYVSSAFGPGWGFAVGWAVLLGYTGICCFEGLALAWLLSVLVPGLAGSVLYTSLDTPVRALDVVVVSGSAAFFTILNVRGARESASVQVAVTVGKLALSFTFVLLGLFGGHAANWVPTFEPAGGAWQGIAGVLVVVPAWFCGFNALPQALREAERRPTTAELARLLAGVIALTTLFYVAVISATAAAAPRTALHAAELPVVVAIEAVAGPWGGRIVLVTAIVALLSAWNAALFAASRLVHALAGQGALSGTLARVHPRFGTPNAAVIFVGAIALAGGLMGRGFIDPLIRLGSIGFAIAFASTCAASLRLRRIAPAQGGRRVVGAAVAGGLLLCGIIGLSLNTLLAPRATWPAEVTALIAWVGIGALLWRLAARRRRATRATGT